MLNVDDLSVLHVTIATSESKIQRLEAHNLELQVELTAAQNKSLDVRRQLHDSEAKCIDFEANAARIAEEHERLKERVAASASESAAAKEGLARVSSQLAEQMEVVKTMDDLRVQLRASQVKIEALEQAVCPVIFFFTHTDNAFAGVHIQH